MENLARKLLEWKYIFFYNVCLRPGYVVSIPPKLQNKQDDKVLCLHEVY